MPRYTAPLQDDELRYLTAIRDRQGRTSGFSDTDIVNGIQSGQCVFYLCQQGGYLLHHSEIRHGRLIIVIDEWWNEAEMPEMLQWLGTYGEVNGMSVATIAVSNEIEGRQWQAQGFQPAAMLLSCDLTAEAAPVHVQPEPPPPPPPVRTKAPRTSRVARPPKLDFEDAEMLSPPANVPTDILRPPGAVELPNGRVLRQPPERM